MKKITASRLSGALGAISGYGVYLLCLKAEGLPSFAPLLLAVVAGGTVGWGLNRLLAGRDAG